MRRTILALVAIGSSFTAVAAPPSQTAQNVTVVNSTANPVPVVVTNGGAAAAVNVHQVWPGFETEDGFYADELFRNTGSAAVVFMTLSATYVAYYDGNATCESFAAKPIFAQFDLRTSDDIIAAVVFAAMELVAEKQTSTGVTCRYVASAPSQLVVGTGQRLVVSVTSSVSAAEASVSASGYTLP